MVRCTSRSRLRRLRDRSHLRLVSAVESASHDGRDGELHSIESARSSSSWAAVCRASPSPIAPGARLNDGGDNAVLVLHALTGDSRRRWRRRLVGAADRSRQGARYRSRTSSICANILGGCQGTTGPASIDPLTGRPYAMRFPLITIGDMVNAQRRLVERLGITRLIAIGGSIGGFQALEWATRHADLVARVRCRRGDRGARTAGDRAQRGRSARDHGRSGLARWRVRQRRRLSGGGARDRAHDRDDALSQSRRAWELRFGRKPATRPSLYPSFGGTFDVEGYIHYHGAALVRRFDANSHLYLTRAMDLYDVGRDGGDEHWLRRIDAPDARWSGSAATGSIRAATCDALRPDLLAAVARKSDIRRARFAATVTTPSSRSGN